MSFPRVSKRQQSTLLAVVCIALPVATAPADILTDVGVRALWSSHPELVGTGVTLALAEAASSVDNVNQKDFEYNPFTIGSNIPTTYININGQTANTFPNAVGTESTHGTGVASFLFGNQGAATGLASVYNYDADYFINSLIFNSVAIPTKVVNQSFVFSVTDPADALTVQKLYDNYVSRYSTVIVSAAGNGGSPVDLPASAYNLITVTTTSGSGSTGTSDGRRKPDIAAPTGPATSFTTPVVTGIAALLVQAGNANTGGAGTAAAATDPRTIKALLLNGAVKNANWSHTATSPLDPVLGAGTVNALFSYNNLAGGRKNTTLTTLTSQAGDPHPAINTGTPLAGTGWNFRTITPSASGDAVHHYLLSLPGTFFYTFTSTLAWNRLLNQDNINNLDLFLYNADSGSLVAQSISTLDNVEQLFNLSLPAGRYDLQVLKHAGGVADAQNNLLTDSYAVAWSAYRLGDANYDGSVDLADFDIWLSHVGATDTTFMTGDFNHSGAVDLADFDIWLSQIGGTPAAMPALASTAAVPEPASVALLGLGATLLLRRKRCGAA